VPTFPDHAHGRAFRPSPFFVCMPLEKREATRPARCVPSPQRGEGQVEGVRTAEINSESSEPPHPNPLPSGERELSVPASADFHVKNLRSRGASRRASFSARERAPANYDHVDRETGSVQGRAGVGPVFRSSVTRFRRFVAWIERSEIRERRFGSIAAPGFRSAQPGLRRKMKEAERRQTQGHQPPHLAMRRAPFWSAHA
jgi:hypothetical protein